MVDFCSANKNPPFLFTFHSSLFPHQHLQVLMLFRGPRKSVFVLNYCLLAVLPKNLLWGDSLAERVGFEPTARCRVTGFQDQLLKPLGHLSV